MSTTFPCGSKVKVGGSTWLNRFRLHSYFYTAVFSLSGATRLAGTFSSGLGGRNMKYIPIGCPTLIDFTLSQ